MTGSRTPRGPARNETSGAWTRNETSCASTRNETARAWRRDETRCARTRNASLAALLIVASATAVLAQEGRPAGGSSIERGDTKFQHTCAPCHGAGVGNDGHAMLPGTEALNIKYRGALPALLEERSDLDYETLKFYLRRGTFSMPPFRPTEVTDAEIADIAAYLAYSSTRSD
jgi:mono/diheme cytochrome c family protein